MDALIISLITFGLLVVIDLVWLGVVGKPIYVKYLGHMMRSRPRWVVALAFYVLYALGLIFFAVYPALFAGTIAIAALHGAFLGLLAYGTYELTNFAVLKHWPWQLVIIDWLWGVVLTSGVASIVFVIAVRLLA